MPKSFLHTLFVHPNNTKAIYNAIVKEFGITNDSISIDKQLKQALIDKKHPDHTLITYPNLGHVFYPSSEWLTSAGPIQPYVLADLYSWLETHSGLSHPYIASPSSTLGTNANTSSSSKR